MCDNGSCKATPSAEDCRNTDNQLQKCGSKGNDVGDKKPANSLLVGADAVLELLREEVFGFIQTPNLDRVEPVL